MSPADLLLLSALLAVITLPLAPTPRQLAILRAVLEAGTIRRGAARLGIAATTAKHALEVARETTGSATTAQLIAWCDDHLPGWRERRPAP